MKTSLPLVGSGSLLIAGIGFMILGGSSCKGAQSSSGGTGPSITFADLQPDQLYAAKGKLTFPSYVVPVDLKRKEKSGTVTFELLASGSVIQIERYASSPSEFGLVEMSMETYTPPLTLLKNPLKVGDQYKWSGNQESGGINRKSWAEITTELTRIPETGLETVHATVNLSVDSSAGAPSKRRIEFWFAKGKGIVKCSYGDAITRSSASPEE